MAKANKNDRFNDTFPTRLRQLVKEKGVTQAELASLLGISRQSFSAYCDGNTQPNIENTVKMAEYFGVSVDYLFGLSDIRTTDPATKSLCESLGISETSIEELRNNPTVGEVVDFLIAQHHNACTNSASKSDGRLYDIVSVVLLLHEFLTICHSQNDAIVSFSSNSDIFMEIIHDDTLQRINYAHPVGNPGIVLEEMSIVRYCAKQKLTDVTMVLNEYVDRQHGKNVFRRMIEMDREIDKLFAEDKNENP